MPKAISPATRGLPTGLWARARRALQKRGHEGIEPSTSPTLKENHTTRPMAHAPVYLGSASRYTCPASPRRRDGNPVAGALPSELRWQSGRLLTDRS